MSNDITLRVLASNPKIEIKKVLGPEIIEVDKTAVVKSENPSIRAFVRDREKLKTTKGLGAEVIEVQKPTVKARDSFSIRTFVTEQNIIKMSNVGPQGGRGLDGAQGPKGEPGSIDSFEMDDLTTIFRGRLI